MISSSFLGQNQTNFFFFVIEEISAGYYTFFKEGDGGGSFWKVGKKLFTLPLTLGEKNTLSDYH